MKGHFFFLKYLESVISFANKKDATVQMTLNLSRQQRQYQNKDVTLQKHQLK